MQPLCLTPWISLTIERTADGEDWKLVARKIPRVAPKKRRLKPINSDEHALAVADQIIDDIRRQPQAGNPRRGYIVFLCKLYPEPLIRDALSIAKADYAGKVKKSLTHVFVGEVKRRVMERKDLTWYNDGKDGA